MPTRAPIRWDAVSPDLKSPRIIIGIPGVLRAVTGSQLLQTTLETVISGMNELQQQNYKIIVSIGERDLWRGTAHLNHS